MACSLWRCGHFFIQGGCIMSSINYSRINADLLRLVYGSEKYTVEHVSTYHCTLESEEKEFRYIELELDNKTSVTLCAGIRDFECIQFSVAITTGDKHILCDETNAVETFREFFGGDDE
jgi:hypothetical protein